MKLRTILSALLSLHATPSPGQILNIVPHQDDDLLFLSPDLLHNIQTGHAVRTVFITAGDSGRGSSYWQDREKGSQAAYALMSDAPDSWSAEDAGIPGHEAPLFTLNQNPNISLVFLRLPDGNLQGQGFEVTGSESLRKLWEGGVSSIHTVSGSGSYTRDELVNALGHLIAGFRPERLNTLDFIHSYGDGDHSDHHSTAFFAKAALEAYENSPVLTGYMGYPAINKTANVFGADLLEKQLAFYAYARSDPNVCNSGLACQSNEYYSWWLGCEYRLDGGPVSNAGSAQVAGLKSIVTLDGTQSLDPNNMTLAYEWTQVGGLPVDLVNSETSRPFFTTPDEPGTLVFELVVRNGKTSSSPAVVVVTTVRHPENIALKARVTASSANVGSRQTPEKVIDARTGGFPADHTNEWATAGGQSGSWLSLSWESPQLVSRIVLYDRPNLDDQITGGTVEFDDGSRIEFGELDNYGTGKSLDVEDRVVRNVTVVVTAVSPSTLNVGLSEVQIFGASASS
ncbi:uncharacterized protein BJX67DRAFT_380358 [Aspergillus lucknowensis]|uniref:N-acetylglucosaminylphosphatidylinositol deacetylase n=1 Tax=Aspergillus lucknowensis TaxID=176173 RepID=A0ABR4LUD1_9EURO